MVDRLRLTETEVIEREDHNVKRYPNLNTVLMVEVFLKKHRDRPMKIAEIRNKLPKQVMHQTLKIVLEYLWASGKIIYGPKGVQWIFADRKEIEEMIKGGTEV